MALSPTNLVIQAAQLPATFVGDPNAFFRAMIERIRIMSASGTSFFVISDVEPASNVGPWLKGGTQWWVYDINLKKYVPLDISASETKWYQVGANVPTTQDPPLWLRTQAGATLPGPAQGQPIGWYLFNGTAWVGFTELLDGEVTLPKLADAPPGSIITFGNTNKAALLALGDADKFLKVNSAGTALEYGDIPATQLAGLLSSQVFGPLTDPGGYNANTQTVTISLSEARECFIFAYCDIGIPNNQFAIATLSVDGIQQDSVRIQDGHLTGGSVDYWQATLMARQSLSAGNHTIAVNIPPAGLFTPAVDNNGRLPVKFIINLL